MQLSEVKEDDLLNKAIAAKATTHEDIADILFDLIGEEPDDEDGFEDWALLIGKVWLRMKACGAIALVLLAVVACSNGDTRPPQQATPIMGTSPADYPLPLPPSLQLGGTPPVLRTR